MTAELEKRLQGYQLATAEILYHLPDHPALLQSFLWQELDLFPKLPVLNKFLGFWTRNLDGKLHSVRVAMTGIFSATELKIRDGEIRIH